MTMAFSILAAVCIGSPCDFDAVSAWVTGVRFARGANRDRVAESPPPRAVARFAMPDGTTNAFDMATIDWKGRHYVERIFTASELKGLADAKFLGVAVDGAEPEDAGIAVEDVHRNGEKKTEKRK